MAQAVWSLYIRRSDRTILVLARWRTISSVEQKEQSKGNSENAKFAEEYRTKFESELGTLCNAILKLLDDSLVPTASDGESKVFFLKMKADYWRYMAEFTKDDARVKAAASATDAYKAAEEVATRDLSVTHPVRLGLALNFSVFQYEALQNPEE